ncbi:MAG: hypothetical protein J3K34DRAFT_449325 [Monoraphidium minutum]|nr:MAG: hypothetical protein J3K34DRAFT_449325 [Monoraphidium minutum]
MVHRAPAPREPAEAGSGGVKHGGRRALPVCQHAPLDALDHVLHDVGCLKLLPAPAPLAPQPPRRLEHCEAQVRPALLGVRARLGARLRRVWAPRRRAVLQPHLRSERRRAAAREPRPQVCQPAQRGPHRRAVQQRVHQRLKRPATGRRRAAGGVAAAHCVGEARLPRAPERRLRPAAAERRVQQHPREAAQLARQEPVARAPPNGAPLRAPLAVPRQRVGAVVVRRRGRRGGRRGLRRRSRRPLCAAHGAHQRGVARRRGVHPRRVVNRRQRGVELLPPPAAERAARPDALQPARLGRVHLQLPRRYFADFRGVGAVSGPAPQARRNSAAWRVEAGHVGRRTQSQQPQAGVAHAEAGERRVP